MFFVCYMILTAGDTAADQKIGSSQFWSHLDPSSETETFHHLPDGPGTSAGGIAMCVEDGAVM